MLQQLFYIVEFFFRHNNRQMRLSVVAAMIVILTTGTAVAQKRKGFGMEGNVIKAYPVAGAVVSQIEGDYLKGFKKWGFTAGVGAQVDLARMWALTVEADFTQRGVFEGTRNSEIPYLIDGFTLNYIDIPVTAHFRDPYGGMMIGLGFIYSRLVTQPHGTIKFNPDYVVPDTSDMSFLKNDLAVAGDLRFTLWRGLQLNFRIQYSIIPIKKGWTFTEYAKVDDPNPKVTVNDCRNFSLMLRVLYVFGGDYDKGSKKSRRR